MARLRAHYQNFWLGGRTYKHFWASSGEAITNANGATITVNGELLTGAVTIDEAIPGQILTLFANIAVDAVGPLNTRLNARYRHFWGRRWTERHFWAQWEGATIAEGGLADGDLVIVSTSEIISGIATGEQFLDGQTLVAAAQLFPGMIPIPGEIIELTAALISGTAEGTGGVLTAFVSLIPGTANGDSVDLVGQTLVVTATLIDGLVTITEPGADLQVDVSIIDGQLSTTEEGQTLVVYVSLDAGMAFESAVLSVHVSIIEGHATGDANIDGQILVVNVSILAGVATGEEGPEPSPIPPPSYRVGGPIGYQRKKEEVREDAQAFGCVFIYAFTILSGKATGTDERPPPSPSIVPEQGVPSVSEFPEAPQPSELGLTEPPLIIQNPVAREAFVQGVFLEHRDWTKYDNDIMVLLL